MTQYSNARPWLARLQRLGSSERVLNLGREGQASGGVFRHPLLARAVLVKHRLAPGEQGLFDPARTSATRLILPTGPNQAASLILGAPGFRQHLEGLAGKDHPVGQSDLGALALLERAPSLDPILVRHTFRAAARRLAFDFVADPARDGPEALQTALRELDAFGVLAPGLSIPTLCATLMAGGSLDRLRRWLALDVDPFEEGMNALVGFVVCKARFGRAQTEVSAAVRRVGLLNCRDTPSRVDRTRLERLKIEVRTGFSQMALELVAALDLPRESLALAARAGDTAAAARFIETAPLAYLSTARRFYALTQVARNLNFTLHPAKARPVSTAAATVRLEEAARHLARAGLEPPPLRPSGPIS